MSDLKPQSRSNLIAARFCLARARRLRPAAARQGDPKDLPANCSSYNLCTDFRLLPICLSSN